MKTKKTTKTKEETKAPSEAQSNFYVVGIGASAGGFEAFSKLLPALPADTGMAFVFVQHLAADHESALVELLSKDASIPVIEVIDGMLIQPNTAYVIPPNKSMLVKDGHLALTPRDKSEKVHRPIDTFFASLSDSHGSRAIGIVLSGTASDGTLGLKNIKEAGGITMVQDSSAKYEDMPKSAVKAEAVDLILSPEDMAKELTRISKFPHDRSATMHITLAPEEEPEVTEGHGDKLESIRKILFLLRRSYGTDFTYYKQATLQRRIMRRVMLERFQGPEEYYTHLVKDESAAETLYGDLLINVTSFFRDAPAYQWLTKMVLPKLLKNEAQADDLRIWVAGCATGEEAYSIAITLLEVLGESSVTRSIKIFATDLNPKCIDQARVGKYPTGALADVSEIRKRNFFTKTDDSYQVKKSLRDMCIFTVHDFVKDPPFSRLDMVSCQNTLIYLEPVLQKKALSAFHYGLKAGGILWLGKSESLGEARGAFTQPNKKHKIYTKKEMATPHDLKFIVRKQSPPDSTELEYKPKPEKKETSIKDEADSLLLSRYAPASVVINSELEIQQFRGETSPYLEPHGERASLDLLKMVRKELTFPLQSAVSKAIKTKQPVQKEGVRITHKDLVRTVGFEVVPLRSHTSESHFLILFKEATQTSPVRTKKISTKEARDTKTHRIAQLEQDQMLAQEEMTSLREEHHAATEELQTANEEALSSNEELQSINEELETSKEELQSTNEELMTINDELQNKNANLLEARNYAEAIVETIREPVVILTDELRVRSANESFYRTFQVTPHQTIGYFLHELGNNQWDIDSLHRLLVQVSSHDEVVTDFEITHKFQSIGEKVMLLNARRLLEEGSKAKLILLAFEDITTRKEVEGEKESQARTKDEFLAMLAHELRNPLAPIVSALELLALEDNNPDAKESIDMIQRQISTMTRLLDDLLDVSRIMRGKITLRKEPVSITRILSNAVETIRPMIDERQHELNISLPKEAIVVEADAVRLEQVFTNLLSNATKYTPDGGHIAISAYQEGSTIFTRIKDSGKGISKELLPKIFDLFTQDDTSLAHSQGGLGIGLRIVKSLVELHGGKVTAESEGAGHGSEFIVSLPIFTGTGKFKQEDSVDVETEHIPKQKILIAEDNNNAATALARLLEKHGHKVRIVHDGKAAIKEARLFKPDVMLLDIGLPEVNGFEVARQVRQHDKKMRIAAITGYGREIDKERSRQSGMDYHLTKPVTLNDINRALKDTK